VPFFWEFHKGHHSAEILHPFGVRTHPVDMFIRNTYLVAGGGLIGGALIYLLGMNFSVAAASYTASALALWGCVWTPFVEAFRTLRPRAPVLAQSPPSGVTAG
jgi:sterol desaturase/sphingolipid hydroxylase (fatty acid hydroxylase superfamily)